MSIIDKKSFQYEKEEEYLKNYLHSITDKKTGKLKRVILSPLRYAGGKTKAVGLILDNLPKLREKKIVSPFLGGGSVEMCLSQQLGIEVICYDIFEMLINFWNQLQNDKDKFIQELKTFEIDSEEFTKNRHILLEYWDSVKPDTLEYNTKKKIPLTENEKKLLFDNKLLQAVYYYYNMTLSYGPMFLGWPSSNEINKEKFNRRIEKLKKSNYKNITFQCEDFQEVIKQHNNDFLYLDPPYYLEGDSKMFKGMYPNCNFAIHHIDFQHDILCELLKNHKGGFILTYNNCEYVRNNYSEFKQVFPEWQYTYGQGETRVGKNRKNTNIDKNTTIDKSKESTSLNVKDSHEIFIICPPLD